MMAGWKNLQLGDCLTLVSGGTPSKGNNEYWGGETPWVTCKDMKVDYITDAEDHLTPSGVKNGTRLAPKNTILIVVRGMILARAFPVALTKREVAFNQDLKAVVPVESVDTGFLFHWFRANTHEILGRADEAGHGTKRIQTDRLLSIPISVPPFSTQQRITGILSAYDDLIENNLRRIRILEEMARSIYREWFVNFRYPGHEQASKRRSPQEPMPEGWETKGLLDVASVVYGFPFASRKFNTAGSGTPIVRIRDVAVGRTETWTEDVAEPKYHIKDGDILVGMDGDFHRCIWSGGHAYQNQRVAKFVSRGEIGNLHLYLVLEEPIQNLNKSIVGTTVAHLGDSHIRAIRITWPPAALRAKARDVLEPLSEKVIVLKNQLRNLRNTRDLLLPRLLSGQVPLGDA